MSCHYAHRLQRVVLSSKWCHLQIFLITKWTRNLWSIFFFFSGWTTINKDDYLLRTFHGGANPKHDNIRMERLRIANYLQHRNLRSLPVHDHSDENRTLNLVKKKFEEFSESHSKKPQFLKNVRMPSLGSWKFFFVWVIWSYKLSWSRANKAPTNPWENIRRYLYGVLRKRHLKIMAQFQLIIEQDVLNCCSFNKAYTVYIEDAIFHEGSSFSKSIHPLEIWKRI